MDTDANLPGDWPVLVTGAGGFIGGHIAREFARAGHPVRALTRRPPHVEPADPPIDWIYGDLREPDVRAAASRGVRGVVHAASWVSLGPDRDGQAAAINVEATRALLKDAAGAGAERFVYTSTLHTLAAGTAEAPADESTPWNLGAVDSPYCRTKRAAERLVLGGSGRLGGVAVVPGMAIGPRDVRPTSTRLIRTMARAPIAIVPGGGIPIVDVEVLATAHRRALLRGEPGARYAVVGPYVSYPDLAAMVALLTGRPRRIVRLPDRAERPALGLAALIERLGLDRFAPIDRVTIAGGFLRLHVAGDRADRAFGLIHPPPIESIRACFADAVRSGRAPRLTLRDDH